MITDTSLVDFESLTLDNEYFPWYWKGKTTYNGHRFLGHTLVCRDTQKIHSSFWEDIVKPEFERLLDKNNLNLKEVLRAAINLTTHFGDKDSEPHTDHDFPHYNMIIYCNDSEGDTVLYTKVDKEDEDKVYLRQSLRISPEKNKVIIFDGTIYHAQGIIPADVWREIIIITFTATPA